MIEFPAQFVGPSGQIQTFYQAWRVPVGWEPYIPPKPPEVKEPSEIYRFTCTAWRGRQTRKRRFKHGVHKRRVRGKGP